MKIILLLLTCLLPFQLRAESTPFVAGKDWFPLPAWSDRAAWTELTGDSAADLIHRGATLFCRNRRKTLSCSAYETILFHTHHVDRTFQLLHLGP